MIALFTDFGLEGPYVGQMKAVLSRLAPAVPVIDLFADLPPYDAQAAAYLLAAYAPELPTGAVFLCVVDPGVGGPRRPAVLEADGHLYVGPDNGLFEIVARRAEAARWWEIVWRPEHLSASFHGRDLFAPVAARLARGERLPDDSTEAVPGEDGELPIGMPRDLDDLRRRDWPDELARVVYVDRFGNAMTGLRASALRRGAVLGVGEHRLRHGQTFGDVAPGSPLWYENSNGLVEIAVNQGRADATLGIAVGAPVEIG
ncbi:MAG: S-adenosyl-l-methionine hydroxide adenosyltransferase family protein [Candidatus Eiseniibacteriota bacterium]